MTEAFWHRLKSLEYSDVVVAGDSDFADKRASFSRAWPRMMRLRVGINSRSKDA